MNDPSVGNPEDTEPETGNADDGVPEEGKEGAWRPLGAGDSSTATTTTRGEAPKTMIPARARRRTAFERVSMRVLATGGIVGLATALGAILVSQDVAGWIVGLVIGLASVLLAAILWSSRQL
jgi:hypothetical protein